jgi:hypothetical protein
MEPLGTQEVEQLITRFKGPIMCYCSAFWALNIIVKSVASSDNQSASAAESPQNVLCSSPHSLHVYDTRTSP